MHIAMPPFTVSGRKSIVSSRSTLAHLAAGVMLSAQVCAQAPIVEGAAPDLEARLNRLERSGSNQGLLDMLQQVSDAQKEVRELRNEVDLLGRRLDDLRQQEKQLYLDVDSRMQKLELSTNAARSTGATPPPPNTVTPPAPAPNTPTVTAPEPAPPNPASGDLPPGLSVETPRPSSSEPAPPPAPVPVPPPPEVQQDAKSMYNSAFQLLKESRYEQAITGFKDFLAKHPQTANAENAQYWLGEAYYVTRQYGSAAEEYQKLAQVYPHSKKVPQALLKLGFSYDEQGQRAQAKKVLEDLKKSHPGSTEARLAEERLQKFKLQQKIDRSE
jgi:tol-pal system protein YbgF